MSCSIDASCHTRYGAVVSAFVPTIGIAGGICSGKSEVARLLGELGCVVSVSDDLARRVLELPQVCEQISAVAGNAVRAADGSIDRAALARAIFTSADVRNAVEAIMHPRIEELRRAHFDAAAVGVPGFVIDAPLLLEAGVDRICDAVIFVDAPTALRHARAISDRAWSADELARREAAQFSLAQKRERCSDTVFNDGDRESLARQVRAVFARICARGPRNH